MTKEALKEKLSSIQSNLSFDETGELLTVTVDKADWLDFATALKSDTELAFDYLFCLTCIDWKTQLTMVYHLDSTQYRHAIVVKSNLPTDAPAIETVSAIWRTAELHEREVYEMFGVNFMNHPDLRLLILPDGWEGKNPLRKDYSDPINMIKL